MWDDSYTAVIEETINGFEVYIEPNPDQYNEGYVWSVSKNEQELDTGLAFSMEDAFKIINQTISLLTTSRH
jgi:hypothetical protein